eukprot:COSAG04_NODE_345_length_16159_cov_5.383126_6_plen_105_part_00
MIPVKLKEGPRFADDLCDDESAAEFKQEMVYTFAAKNTQQTSGDDGDAESADGANTPHQIRMTNRMAEETNETLQKLGTPSPPNPPHQQPAKDDVHAQPASSTR